MRVVFMGTPAFALPSLRALVERHEVVAVYTRPDRPSGRGRALTPSPVKATAEASGIPLAQPGSFDAAEVESLRRLEADVAVVAAYGVILPAGALDVPRYGFVNVHASLLPRWRGAAPVQRAILAGDPVTGVSIMRVVEALDAGPFAAQVEVPVGESSAPSLEKTLSEAAVTPLLATLNDVGKGTVVWHEQDESAATYARKVTAADVALDPGLPVVAALRRVRASGPSAPSRARIGRVDVVVSAAGSAPEAPAVPPGHVVATKSGLLLGFSDGAVRVEALTPPGRSRMDGGAWARGARLTDQALWGPVE